MMALVALGMLVVGTLCGWCARDVLEQDRRNRRLRRIMSECSPRTVEEVHLSTEDEDPSITIWM